jgi:hypothetical protein
VNQPRASGAGLGVPPKRPHRLRQARPRRPQRSATHAADAAPGFGVRDQHGVRVSAFPAQRELLSRPSVSAAHGRG